MHVSKVQSECQGRTEGRIDTELTTNKLKRDGVKAKNTKWSCKVLRFGMSGWQNASKSRKNDRPIKLKRTKVESHSNLTFPRLIGLTQKELQVSSASLKPVYYDDFSFKFQLPDAKRQTHRHFLSMEYLKVPSLLLTWKVHSDAESFILISAKLTQCFPSMICKTAPFILLRSFSSS